MKLSARVRSWFRASLHRTRMEREMDNELHFHLESYTEDLIRRGVSPEEARGRARVKFGAIEARKEECREALGLRLIDERRILCRYADGTQPFLLHHILAKPWLKTTRTTVYSLLLPRLLLAPDVALRLEPDQLPLRLREGRLAMADRRRANVQALIYSHSRRQLGRFGIRTRIARWRRSRELDPA